MHFTREPFCGAEGNGRKGRAGWSRCRAGCAGIFFLFFSVLSPLTLNHSSHTYLGRYSVRSASGFAKTSIEMQCSACCTMRCECTRPSSTGPHGHMSRKARCTVRITIVLVLVLEPPPFDSAIFISLVNSWYLFSGECWLEVGGEL